jgi:dihydrofolate reductase
MSDVDCCHPALAMEVRVALTLRMVGGLTVPEIARAFLVQETGMGRRITRAKAKIKAARIPYRVPSPEDLPALFTPPTPTCCAGWAGARSRGRRTTGPSRWPATPPRRPTSSAAATSWPDREAHGRPELRPRPNDDQTDEKGSATMKLMTITHVTVDGVMQGLGGADEDRSGGFERGGWALPLFGGEAATFLDEVFQRADAFLFGRRTYEIFAGSWGTGSWGGNQGNNPISAALNTLPKYVASTTLTDPQWADTTVLSGDVAAAVGELKAKPGGELQVHGSGNLIRWLLDNELVDEITLLTYPVVVGQGTRLFPDTGRDRALELVESRATPSGVTIQVYRPAGRPQYAT